MELSILPLLFLLAATLQAQSTNAQPSNVRGRRPQRGLEAETSPKNQATGFLLVDLDAQSASMSMAMMSEESTSEFVGATKSSKAPNDRGKQGKAGKGPDLQSRIEFSLDPWLPHEDKDDAAQRLAIPSLTQPFYDMVLDVRSTMSAVDLELIFSTNGNWMAGLMKLLDTKYFLENESVQDSYLITSSPPISIAQMESGLVKVGNILYKNAEPHLVAGPGKYLNNFEGRGYGNGARIPIIKTYGNVILKRKGDPKIQSFADLVHIEPGRFASSDPAEAGSYNNYRDSVYNIALNNPDMLGVSENAIADAAALQYRLFDEAGAATIGAPMHRSVPHTIATGQADAGLIFLHLAVVAMQENPGVFEAIYLAKDLDGSTDDPDILLIGQDPLEGNKVGTFFVLRTITDVSEAQETARENFILDLRSSDFTDILTEVGLLRPPGFVAI
eukprot:CAMPEP_0172324062 /NCGR_PEP_ID=MMETSP1058-20130122/50294_1 /TAXON_ID=83371 /ORGANISM="Detonula confervacea, Strain CCMP 353" /LENGTH=443 /DNA_ID=CAMNT_0013040227 /DNA_START=123 /DNA_END=1454 /DNA_ORIENTATION=-